MENFTNVTVDIEQLPKVEEVKLIPISKGYLKVIIFNLIIFTLIAVSASLLSFLYLETGTLFQKIIFLLVKLSIIVLIDFLVLFSFYRKSYAFREKDLIYRSGIITENNDIIPYNRIQHVTLKQSWLSRILTIASIEVYTASGNKGAIEIPGIPLTTAHQLKDFLLHKISHQQEPKVESIVETTAVEQAPETSLDD